MPKLTQKGIKFDWGKGREENAFSVNKQKLCSAQFWSLPEGAERLCGLLWMRQHGLRSYADEQIVSCVRRNSLQRYAPVCGNEPVEIMEGEIKRLKRKRDTNDLDWPYLLQVFDGVIPYFGYLLFNFQRSFTEVNKARGPLQAKLCYKGKSMGACSLHMKPRSVVSKAIRQGYYWPTMHRDAWKKYECDSCNPCPGAKDAQNTHDVNHGHLAILSIGNGCGWTLPRSAKKEVGMPTHRTMMIKDGKDNEEEIRLNLDLLIERREAATIRESRNEASRVEDLGKLGPKWEGPYLVIEAYDNGSYKLQTMEGREVPRTWHAINLRRCYL
ncbi:hypothetical protein Tco_0185981 [Tanacetum coccineum]